MARSHCLLHACVGVFISDPYFENSFGDTGFRADFQDGSNQVRHFVGWFAAGFLVTPAVAKNRLYNSEGTNSVLNPDVALGLLAIDLGSSFNGNAKQLAQDIWHKACGETSNLRYLDDLP